MNIAFQKQLYISFYVCDTHMGVLRFTQLLRYLVARGYGITKIISKTIPVSTRHFMKIKRRQQCIIYPVNMNEKILFEMAKALTINEFYAENNNNEELSKTFYGILKSLA